jgi:hypothetical protein
LGDLNVFKSDGSDARAASGQERGWQTAVGGRGHVDATPRRRDVDQRSVQEGAMTPSTVIPEMFEEEIDLTATRRLTALMYRQRLERLLTLELAEDARAMTTDEQRRLVNAAVLATVDALTELGDGASASALLRRAKRR